MTTIDLPEAFDVAAAAQKRSPLTLNQVYVDEIGDQIHLEATIQGNRMQRLLTTTYFTSQSEGSVNQCPIEELIAFDDLDTIAISYEDEEAKQSKRPTRIAILSKETGLINLDLEWAIDDENTPENPDFTQQTLTQLSMTKNGKRMDIHEFGDVHIDGREYGGLGFMPKTMNDTEYANATAERLSDSPAEANEAVRNLLSGLKNAGSMQEISAAFAAIVKFQEPPQRGAARS